MKVKKLLEVIDASAEPFDVANDLTTSSALRELALALKPRSGLELSFIADVLGNRRVGQPSRLSAALRSIAKVQRASGAKKFAADFELLADQASDGSITSLIKNLDLVGYFVQRLREADSDIPAVQRLLKVMGSAGMLGAKEAAEIATRYTNAPTVYRNKKAALEAVRDRVARDAGLASKSRMSS